MSYECYYRVAGLPFGLLLPPEVQADRLLPAFAPFRCAEPPAERCLFHFMSAPEAFFHDRRALLVEETRTDLMRMRLFHDADGYQIEARTRIGHTHRLHADPDFAFVRAAIHWADPYAAEALSAMLRIVYSQAALTEGAVSVHAAAVQCGGRAYLFMGKSGTGKSTHARLWLRGCPTATLLNDDNPTLRLLPVPAPDGDPTKAAVCAMAYGTPWSGKTPCYRNEGYPIGGIARLQQAHYNSYTARHEVDAFITLLPGCAAFPGNSHRHSLLCDILVRLAALVPVGRLRCLPNMAAARLCASAWGAEWGGALPHAAE